MIASTEPLEAINKRLKDNYGRFSTYDIPMYRVVWSQDQFEKRLTEYTDEGWQLLQPEVRELPKYRQWNANCFILERCLAVPSNTDLVEPYSYEPLWAFLDHNGNALPPTYTACEMLIEAVLVAAAQAVGVHKTAKYKDPYSGLKKDEIIEKKRMELDSLEKELFGNETSANTALAHGWGVSLNHSDHNKKELDK